MEFEIPHPFHAIPLASSLLDHPGQTLLFVEDKELRALVLPTIVVAKVHLAPKVPQFFCT
jgi:hypothetical protein